MSSSIVAGVLAAAGETGMTELTEIELPIPPLGFGIVTLVMFLVLLGITYSFKNVAARR